MDTKQQALASAYEQQYGCAPAAVARAPGRVNLIGEHIDYEGYGVLPMAICQAVSVAIGWQQHAAGAGKDQGHQLLLLQAANTQPGYPAGQLRWDMRSQAAPEGAHGWLRYVAAALRGCAELAAARQHAIPCGSGRTMLLLVQGEVPAGAGLSSSSAVVVAASLALLALWQLPASAHEAADMACRCERFVGTQGGGMDQAISLLAQPGRALHITFNPVHASPVSLPPGGVLVVANCLAPSHKAETASTRFNLRVLECRLAAMLLAHRLQQEWRQVQVLSQVEEGLRLYAAAQHSTADGAVAWGVQQLLPQASSSLEQVASALGTSQDALLAMLPPALQAAAAGATELLLQHRALHVFGEAARVIAFRDACQSDAGNEDKLRALGQLMDASHASCAGLYQCSCDELDRLVDAARKAGALGARLTGAGWGGCTVSLVREADAPQFIAALRESYFAPLVAAGVVAEAELGECLFASKPSSGAAVMQLQLAVEPAEAEAAPAAEPVAVA